METKLLSMDRLTLLHPVDRFRANCIFLSLKYNIKYLQPKQNMKKSYWYARFHALILCRTS